MRQDRFGGTPRKVDIGNKATRRWQSGATAVEYGIIAAFVALSIYVGAIVAGNGIGDIFFAMAEQIKNAVE